MKNICTLLAFAALAATSASAQGTTLTSDPLTGLALSPATASKFGNSPDKMHDGVVCKSKMQGNFYRMNISPTDNTTMGPQVAWYTSHLKGFAHVHGYESKRSQDVFYNADGTVVVILTSDTGPESASLPVFAVAYEHYQPGLKPGAFKALSTGNIDCR